MRRTLATLAAASRLVAMPATAQAVRAADGARNRSKARRVAFRVVR